MQNYTVQPGGRLQGECTIPGDKSISHRAIILGAIAEGVTRMTGFLPSLDCLATVKAFHALGVDITQPVNDQLIIKGVGLNGLQAPTETINLGNSGTSIRLLTGLLAGQSFTTCLTGDVSLSRRPMARLVSPLQQMGAVITMRENNFPPLHITGNKNLQGINYGMPVASAQVKSGLLLAGLYATGKTIIKETNSTRNHTEILLKAFGCQLLQNNQQIILEKPKQLNAINLTIPADLSSAAFFITGATIAPGSAIILKNIGVNPTRTGVIKILQMMGADIQLQNLRLAGEEPIADIQVKYSRLQGIKIPKELVPSAIDEFPIIFIAAACAQGNTVLTNAEELRTKESDRIQVMAEGLTKLGIKAQSTTDGIQITGGRITGGEIDSKGDHRIAMAFAMAGLIAQDKLIIKDCANIATSFPNFIESAQQAGLNIKTSL